LIEPYSNTDTPADPLALAREQLLLPADLDFASLDRALSAAMGRSLDYADLYLQLVRYETWTVEDGLVKEGTYKLDRGLGVHAVSGERAGFAYSERLDGASLMDAVAAARGIAQSQGDGRIKVATRRPCCALYPNADGLQGLSDERKVALLTDLDHRARAMDRRVVQVLGTLAGVYEVMLVQGSDGALAADVRPLVRLNLTVIMQDGGRREQGFAGGGGRGDFAVIMGNGRPLELAAEAVRSACVNMEAVPSPSGNMPVVLGSGWPGILLHEAIGHGLEGDFNRKGTSAFSGRIGERVAPEHCTIVDDGTLAGRRGSLNVDDEGTPTQCNTLVEAGMLTGYLHDKTSARLLQAKPTGNGRRESFAHAPIPRMTNTYMLPGTYDPEEIIASVDKGIYASNFGGGQVDIASGRFVFSTTEAYLIERGKRTTPVKGAMLIGSGPEVLTRVSMVGSDLQLDGGQGTCSKDGQSVPVGVGQPTIRVDSLTVGGTRA